MAKSFLTVIEQIQQDLVLEKEACLQQANEHQAQMKSFEIQKNIELENSQKEFMNLKEELNSRQLETSEKESSLNEQLNRLKGNLDLPTELNFFKADWESAVSELNQAKQLEDVVKTLTSEVNQSQNNLEKALSDLKSSQQLVTELQSQIEAHDSLSNKNFFSVLIFSAT